MQAQNIHPASASTAKPPPSALQGTPHTTTVSNHASSYWMSHGAWIMTGFVLGVLLSGIAAGVTKWRRSKWKSKDGLSSPSIFKVISKSVRRHWIIVVSILAYLTVLAACSYIDPGKGIPHNLIAGVLPFIGTLVGAGVAFMNDRIKEDKRIEDSQVLAINKALHALFVQLNELGMINRTIQEVQRRKGDHPINLDAMAIPDNLDARVNTDELAFLIDHRQVEIITSLDVEQRRFDAAFFSLHTRNKLMVDVIQPKIAEAGINRQILDDAGVFAALGEYAYGLLITSTSNVLENVPSTVESCQPVMNKLTTIGKALFPHRVILKFGGFNPPPA